MPITNTNMKIASSTYSNMTDRVSDVLVDSETLDNASGSEETVWVNANWSKYLGYYKTIPEVKMAIDARAIWTLGKGYKADARTTVILDHIKGSGRDSFNSILKNMMITCRIGGDSFAEIIRADDKNKTLLNLKPLDPGSIKIIFDKKGMLKRYEQVTQNPKGVIKFKPDEIFHLSNKRIANEMHGVSDIEAIEEIIKANNESFVIQKDITKKFSKPMMKFSLDTDDDTKISALVTKFDAAVNKGENLYIPKGTVEQELIAVPPNATLNILPWRDHLKNYFFQTVGIPQIILGSANDFTESSAKIAYLSFQQSVESEQLQIEECVWNQLYLRIELSFPATIQNEMISDTEKDGADQQMGMQPGDMMSGAI